MFNPDLRAQMGYREMNRIASIHPTIRSRAPHPSIRAWRTYEDVWDRWIVEMLTGSSRSPFDVEWTDELAWMWRRRGFTKFDLLAL